MGWRSGAAGVEGGAREVGLKGWSWKSGSEAGGKNHGGVGGWKGGRKLLDIKFILTVQQRLLPIAKEMMYFILLTFVI